MALLIFNHLFARWCWRFWCGFWFTTSTSIKLVVLCHFISVRRCYTINTCVIKNKSVSLLIFKTKYTISLIDSKWTPLKRNIKFTVLPRKDEFVYFESKYYVVLNVIHTLNDIQHIFVIVEESTLQPEK